MGYRPLASLNLFVAGTPSAKQVETCGMAAHRSIGQASWITAPSFYHRDRNDDDVRVLVLENSMVILLADGATGLGYGDVASRIFVDTLEERLSNDPDSDLRMAFEVANYRIAMCGHPCDTTGIAVQIYADGRVRGACVGDSEVYSVSRDGGWPPHLTRGQYRKPRIGSGSLTVLFDYQLAPGEQLIFASDGLWNSLGITEVMQVATQEDLKPHEHLRNLLRAVDQDSRYDDDITIVLYTHNTLNLNLTTTPSQSPPRAAAATTKIGALIPLPTRKPSPIPG